MHIPKYMISYSYSKGFFQLVEIKRTSLLHVKVKKCAWTQNCGLCSFLFSCIKSKVTRNDYYSNESVDDTDLGEDYRRHNKTLGSEV